MSFLLPFLTFFWDLSVDTSRFAAFNLQVKLLKETLEAWKREVEKKPPSMSVDDAYEVLNLPKGQGQ